MMYLSGGRIAKIEIKSPSLLARTYYMTLTQDPCDATMMYYVSNLHREVNPLLF